MQSRAQTIPALRATFGSVPLALVAACSSPEPGTTRTTIDYIERPGMYEPLCTPTYSYCSTLAREGLVRDEDRVVAWLRGPHNGGAVPLRLFLTESRVVNDACGLFCYDPDGGFVSAWVPVPELAEGPGFRFHGWRRGTMVIESPDGTLWYALSGRAFLGPRKGETLRRLPSLVTDWRQWLMLHPESSTFAIGEQGPGPAPRSARYLSSEARDTMGMVDWRLPPLQEILGIEVGNRSLAVPLDRLGDRAALRCEIEGQGVVLFWYAPTRTAVAFREEIDGQTFTFRADASAPEIACFQDQETGSHWTPAGRAVDGPMRGVQLEWVSSLQCRWYAWVAQYPNTVVYE